MTSSTDRPGRPVRRRLDLVLLAACVLLGLDILTRLSETASADPQAPNPAPTLIGFTATPTKSEANVIIWRHWSNGVIDKRLFHSTRNLSHQDGWVVVQQGW